MVREFHEAFGLVVRDQPQESIPTAESEFRRELLREEWEEADEALWFAGHSGEMDATHVMRELADLLYIAYGTALHYGVDLDAAVAEVHRANMSKLGTDGNPLRREDGKVLKGQNYQPPDVARAIGLDG